MQLTDVDLNKLPVDDMELATFITLDVIGVALSITFLLGKQSATTSGHLEGVVEVLLDIVVGSNAQITQECARRLRLLEFLCGALQTQPRLALETYCRQDLRLLNVQHRCSEQVSNEQKQGKGCSTTMSLYF